MWEKEPSAYWKWIKEDFFKVTGQDVNTVQQQHQPSPANNEAFLYNIFPSSWSILPHYNHNSKNNDNDECKKEDYENAFSSNLVCSFFFSCVGAYGIIIQIKTDKSLCAKLWN